MISSWDLSRVVLPSQNQDSQDAKYPFDAGICSAQLKTFRKKWKSTFLETPMYGMIFILFNLLPSVFL